MATDMRNDDWLPPASLSAATPTGVLGSEVVLRSNDRGQFCGEDVPDWAKHPDTPIGIQVVRLVLAFKDKDKPKLHHHVASGLATDSYIFTVAPDNESTLQLHAIYFTNSAVARIDDYAQWGTCETTLWQKHEETNMVILKIHKWDDDSRDRIHSSQPWKSLCVATSLRAQETTYTLGYPACPACNHDVSLKQMFHNYDTRVCSVGQIILPHFVTSAPAAVAVAAVTSASCLQYVAYSVNSLGGMNGGPVFNRAGELVGVHIKHNIMYPLVGNQMLADVLRTHQFVR
jgi:hypothetical protein